MTKVIKIVTDGMKSSDKMFTEWEEKRLKFEEQQRKEECEFQLNMIQMLQQGMESRNFYAPYSSLPPSAPSGLYYGPPGFGTGANDS